MEIYPSIASADTLDLGGEIRRLGAWRNLHIDIEDGNFTPNITFGLKTVESICKVSEAKQKQVHLMVTSPVDFILPLRDCGVTEVIAHLEAMDNPVHFIRTCKESGMKAGLALKAGSEIRMIEPFLDIIDSVLFLTSAPMPVKEYFSQDAFDNALAAAKLLAGNAALYADGGLREEHLRILNESGFDGVILGRLVFNGADPFSNICHLNSILE